MPQYLSPGVFVEELSFRAKSIEGVSTSTCAFVGPTRKGPLGIAPTLITDAGEFERIYGGLSNLSYSAATDTHPDAINFMAHSVRAYFQNGGQRLYVARTFSPRVDGRGSLVSDGVAHARLCSNAANSAEFVARTPGSGLNGSIRVYLKKSVASAASLNAAPQGSLLSVGSLYYEKHAHAWIGGSNASSILDVSSVTGAELLTFQVQTIDSDGSALSYDNLGFAATHPRWIGKILALQPVQTADALNNPFALKITGSVNAFELRAALFGTRDENAFALMGGNDGAEPSVERYKAALALLEKIPDISVIAAPGHSALTAASFTSVQQALIAHAEKMRHRIAVLDTPQAQAINAARQTRSKIDSSRAALYFPWVIATDPLAQMRGNRTPSEITLPPSGFICGIYARTDRTRGVWKAPANEEVYGALRFERALTQENQELLNPEGVNCLRFFPGRGNRVWGARTASADPEWRYVNVRRYFMYLERSIEQGTQWAVFESNNEALWANVRATIQNFLSNEWRNGALQGTKPEDAFFVHCDRTSMTQNDIDQGRLICLIGVAPIKPAEFVIFRISQKTAQA